MVSTRGQQSAVVSDPNAPAASDVIGTADQAIAESRVRKRRRSASPQAERTSPTNNRQTVSSSNPTTAKREKLITSPRAARHRSSTGIMQPYDAAQSTSAASAGAVTTAPIFSSVNDPPVIISSHAGIQNIMATTMENNGVAYGTYSSQGYEDMGVINTADLLPQGASIHVKVQSLPILDNLVRSQA